MAYIKPSTKMARYKRAQPVRAKPSKSRTLVRSRKGSSHVTKVIQKIVDDKMRADSIRRSSLQTPSVVRAFPKCIEVFQSGSRVGENYSRVPVTRAIPRERGSGVEADQRYRLSQTVFLRGVGVRFVLEAICSVEVLLFVYPAKVFAGDSKLVVEGSPPVSFAIGTSEEKNGENRRLLTMDETQMKTPHGPFGLESGGNSRVGYNLQNVDESLFTCYMARHEGKPVGKVDYTDDSGAKKVATVYRRKFVHPNPGTVMTHNENLFFTLQRWVKFVASGEAEMSFEDDLEMFLGVRCSGAQEAGSSVVGANMVGFQIVLY